MRNRSRQLPGTDGRCFVTCTAVHTRSKFYVCFNARLWPNYWGDSVETWPIRKGELSVSRYIIFERGIRDIRGVV